MKRSSTRGTGCFAENLAAARFSTLKVFGTLLIVLGVLALAFLGWLATKGYFTTKGLIVAVPGRIEPVSAVTVLAVVLSIVILGVVLLLLGRRPHKTGTGNSQQSVSQNS